MTNLITLTTDFGLTDGFVGVIKGVILSINPEAQCVDISHDVARQDIQQGAFVLANSVPYFPPAAIHVCVVDPGVGSERRAIAVRVGEAVLVGPDNGVLSLAAEALLERTPGAEPRVFHLNDPRFWLPRVSTTFHGRDVFSPCAAHLSRGVSLEEMGTAVDDWIKLAPSKPIRRKDGSFQGHVIYVDRYGNIVTDITEDTIKGWAPANLTVEIAGREIHGLVRTYSDVEPGDFATFIGSPWKLEIAQRESNAAESLGVFPGDEIVIRHAREE